MRCLSSASKSYAYVSPPHPQPFEQLSQWIKPRNVESRHKNLHSRAD